MMRVAARVALMSVLVLLAGRHPLAGADGSIDLNYYYDTRETTVLTINSLAAISEKYEYFSLVDYLGENDNLDEFDTSLYYTEQNLRRSLGREGLWALSAQGVAQSGHRNDLLRLGVLVKLSGIPGLKEFLDGKSNYFSINFFPIQLDHRGGANWQVEYFYRFQLLPGTFGDRLYLSGFADQDFVDEFDAKWVTQHQLGYRAIGRFYLVSEYRYNGHLASRRSGLGLGLEYLIAF